MGLESAKSTSVAGNLGHIRLLQRRLLHPSYEAPGKWVISNPFTRTDMLAVRTPSDHRERVAPTMVRALFSLTSAGDFSDMAALGVLRSTGLQSSVGTCFESNSSIRHFYFHYVHDFPFVDYSDASALAIDADRMRKYSAVASPPPLRTPRNGSVISLPDGRVGWECPDTLNWLSWLLYLAVGEFEIVSQPGRTKFIRKASPSGGAKHPTELWLLLPVAKFGIDAGTYIYAPGVHGLVRSSRDDHMVATGTTISLRARVERAMWRYREPRSFRAIPIDVGHVLGTIAMALEATETEYRYSLPRVQGSLSDLEEPEFAAILLAGEDDVRWASPEARSHRRMTEGAERPGTYGTNPTLTFRCGPGVVEGEVLMPSAATAEVDEIDFAILDHCLISHRGAPVRDGDRRTTLTAILDAVDGATPTRVERLNDLALLLSYQKAVELRQSVVPWSESGWYLPLLALLDPAPEAVSEYYSSVTGTRDILPPARLSAVLRTRRTIRNFLQEEIPRHVFDRLHALVGRHGLSSAMVALSVEGMAAGTIVFQNVESDAQLGEVLTRKLMQDLNIGQSWVRDASVCMWLISKLDQDDDPLKELIKMGEVAQRLIVEAIDRGYGCYSSPAMRDASFEAAFKVRGPVIAYGIAVGRPGEN